VHVAESLGDAVDVIVDGGPCRIGLESTVVGLNGREVHLLRPGGVSTEDVERVVGRLGDPTDDAGAPRSPGRLLSHYAPRLPLRLDATSVRPNEALLAFGPASPPGAALVRNLSLAGDLIEAAANLFQMLRELDRPELGAIAVAPIPGTGLGAAINDRLRRAAAPRDLR
jgi:L-threonylcarbamoyladenylate synthase